MKYIQLLGGIAALTGALVLQGCNHEAMPRDYSVQIDNLTANQPFAPVASVWHSDGYHIYTLGEMASEELETLAEGGDGSSLLSAAASNIQVSETAAGSGIIAPGANETISVQGLPWSSRLSLVAMLVNTNDGFIGLDNIDISNLAVNESVSVYANVYDAGTETNDEAAAHLPGQGGEGWNAARDDRDYIAVHPGVISADDGLAGSALDESHRFNQPGARIVITRTH